jgi:hypothetical protein
MRAALRISNNSLTASQEFETETMIDPVSNSASIISGKSIEMECDPPKKKWVNVALASILTLAPVSIPIEIYNRRYGVSSTFADLLELDEESDDYFLFPGGIMIPNPERKVLFRKLLKLEGLEKRKPYLNF